MYSMKLTKICLYALLLSVAYNWTVDTTQDIGSCKSNADCSTNAKCCVMSTVAIDDYMRANVTGIICLSPTLLTNFSKDACDKAVNGSFNSSMYD